MRCLMPDSLNQLMQHCGYQFKAHLALTWSAATSQHFCKSGPRVRNDAPWKRPHKQSWEKCLVHTTCSIRIHWKRHWANPALHCTIQVSLHWEGFVLCPAISRHRQPRPLVHSTCPCSILLTAPSFPNFFFIICPKKQLATHVHYSSFPLWCFPPVCSSVVKGHFLTARTQRAAPRLHKYSESLTLQI